MRHGQIQCNFGGIEDLCKLGKEYLIALPHKLHISFDTLHAFISLVVAKLSDFKKQSGFLTHSVVSPLLSSMCSQPILVSCITPNDLGGQRHISAIPTRLKLSFHKSHLLQVSPATASEVRSCNYERT